MAVSQSAVASLVIEAPIHRFQHYGAAVQAMADYQAALCENASQRRSQGFAVTDQDQPDEVFCLCPAGADQPPLAITAAKVDGMAALLEEACPPPQKPAPTPLPQVSRAKKARA